MSYNSKYTGQQVEALLDMVSQGGGTGGEGGEVQKTTEAEILAMGFTKNQGTITEVKMNGVSKGTSGVVDLGTVITEHQDISGKVDKVTGKQLSTEDFTTALKQKLEGLSNYNDTEINEAVSSLQTQLNTLVSGNANDAINSFNEIIAFLDGIKDSQDLSSIIESIEQQIASKMDKVTLANVATSGSYNDLNDKPTIPSAVTESTVSGWGFTKNTGTYSKPSGGIPKTDLSSDVQSALTKANSALQEHQQLKTINGESIVGSGNIVIESGSGGSSGDSKEKIYIFDCGIVTEGTLEDGLVQDLYDNYKIIGFNYNYILYLGRVSKVFFRGTYMISVYSFFPLNGVNFQYTLLLQSSDNTWSLSTSILGAGLSETHLSQEDYQYSLLPNVLYVWDEVERLELSFDEGTEGAANEYLFQFTSGSTPTTLTLPDGIKWVSEPIIEANKTYQVSVVNNIGIIVGV